jgi:Holliday junction DNA helicase RuvA
MIDLITGQVVSVTNQMVVILVGGVGLRVNVPTAIRDTVGGPGQTVTLYTHLVVREDDLSLYGFAEQDERALFETLIKISGIGPRIALAILSTLTVERLKNAVAREEADVLTRVPGVGKKLAQKLVIELKDKLEIDRVTGLTAMSGVDTDVLAALTALGYSVVEAQAAIQSIPRDAAHNVEERVMLALQYFA